MTQNESWHNTLLVRKLRVVPGAVVFKHNDQSTAGIPDISFTYMQHVSWIECKVGRPKGRGIQLQTMKDLQKASGFAWYVVFTEDSTYILRPLAYEAFMEDVTAAVARFDAKDFIAVAAHFQRYHRDHVCMKCAGGGHAESLEDLADASRV